MSLKHRTEKIHWIRTVGKSSEESNRKKCRNYGRNLNHYCYGANMQKR